MLEMFVVREAVFFLTGVMIGIGLIARVITGVSLKKMVKAASNMSKSTHPLMRLVRAKFEHGCMVSDKVQNVEAFVEKYLYEYRVFGVRLHTWRQWTKGSIWLCILLGGTGMALAYLAGESRSGMYRYGVLGAAGAIGLFLLRMLSDDAYQLEAVKTYMVDFLENTYAHRYAKANQKEIQVTVQRADEAEKNVAAEGNEDRGMEMQEDLESRGVEREVMRNKDGGRADTGRRMQMPESAMPENAVRVNAVPAERVSSEETMEKERQAGKREERESVRYQQEETDRYQKEETNDRMEPAKEARIREILEEFLA